jgi:tRNA-2-methylthio-N6-dimethylallyladenosine synthase
MKLFVQTYGCQMNQLDSNRIVHLMKQMHYEATERVEEADLIILNTCSVRDKAEQKVYSALGRWRPLKENRGALLGVGGCVAQQEGEKLLSRIPHLDFVFGTHNIHKLPDLVVEAREKRRASEVEFYRDASYLEDPAGIPEVQGPKAFVTIMQGCNKVCSFCIVPRTRGREVSRPSKNILEEVKTLVGRGVKEVMLLGQNVNSYGLSNPADVSFPELLKKINNVDGLERIRFTTSHPQDLSPELVEAFATLEKLCEHLHLPLQSGSDTVLQRMRRGYSTSQYLERINRLRDRCPGIALSTDIIVGFPGETETEFEDTLAIMEDIEYDDMFAFTYSPRPKTVAAKLYADDVREEVKKERLRRLHELQGRISLEKHRKLIGQEQEILVEGPSRLRDDQLMGRTRTNRIVNMASEPAIGPADLAIVRLVRASPNSLIGEWSVTEGVTL